MRLIDQSEIRFKAEVVNQLICEVAVQRQVIQLRHRSVWISGFKIALLRVLENPWLLTWAEKEIKENDGAWGWGYVSTGSKRLTNDEVGGGIFSQ